MIIKNKLWISIVKFMELTDWVDLVPSKKATLKMNRKKAASCRPAIVRVSFTFDHCKNCNMSIFNQCELHSCVDLICQRCWVDGKIERWMDPANKMLKNWTSCDIQMVFCVHFHTALSAVPPHSNAIQCITNIWSYIRLPTTLAMQKRNKPTHYIAALVWTHTRCHLLLRQRQAGKMQKFIAIANVNSATRIQICIARESSTVPHVTQPKIVEGERAKRETMDNSTRVRVRVNEWTGAPFPKFPTEITTTKNALTPQK